METLEEKNNVGQPPPAVQPLALPPRRLAEPARAEYRRHLPHLQCEDKPLYVTFVTYKRWVLLESIRNIVLKHCLHDHGIKLQVHGVVVMPDHVHLIFTPLKDSLGNSFGLAEIMSGIKGASAHSLNKALNRRGKVWQDESFDHVLRSDESIHSKVQYICENPVRKDLVISINDYPWLWREWVEGMTGSPLPGENGAQPPSAAPK